jgi:ABC-type transport system involved in multi-copper enzyme maturation permease subunit
MLKPRISRESLKKIPQVLKAIMAPALPPIRRTLRSLRAIMARALAPIRRALGPLKPIIAPVLVPIRRALGSLRATMARARLNVRRTPGSLKATMARARLNIRRSLPLLKAIIAREFLNNLLNLRFIMGLILCVVITVACIAILAHDYRQELADYNDRVNMQDDFLNNYATHGALFWTNRQPKPPERFRPLIVGIARDNALASFDANPLPILFPYLDFLFIVTIVMSLLALLFSYDAVTGERQRGTLRQVIANSVSRTTVLLGKFIGGTASLLIPFILALLVGVLYINLNPNIQWDGAAWAELGLLTAASITFITLFYLLGLMVSTLSRYSAVSILNCLFLWVLLILVIPNLCPYVSAQVHRLPSIRETERREGEIRRETLHLVRLCKEEVREEFRGRHGRLFADWESMEFGSGEEAHQEAFRQRMAADPEFKAMIDAFGQELKQAPAPIWRSGYAREDDIRDALVTKAHQQTKLAKTLTCISPLADFVYVARGLTGTGLRALEHFDRVDGKYRGRVWDYADEKLKEGRAEDPTFSRDSFIDLSNRPRFAFKEEALRDKLGKVLPCWGILVAFNVLFFVAAFAGFIRYDVR